MAQNDPLDYLGQPAPISFNERAGLPIGSLPPAAPGPVGSPVGEGGLGGVAAPVGSFAGDGAPGDFGGGGFLGAFGPGTFVTDPATGIASRAAGPATTELAVTGEGDTGTGTELLSILKAIGGAEGGAKQILNLLRDMGLGVDVQTSVLAPSDFSFAAESPGSVLENASNFDLAGADPSAGSTPIPTDRITLGRQSLNAADLPRALQDLPLFMGDTQFPTDMFSFAADAPTSALNPADFALGGQSPDSVLNAGDFSLGDTSLDTGVGGDGGAGIPYFGAALSIANSIAGALANPSQDMAGAAVRGIIDGVKAMAQSTHPVMGLWNIPGLVFNLVKLFEGGRDERNRAERTAQGQQLAGETFGPIGDAFSGRQDIRDVLAQRVGGSTIGDALASLLSYTSSGARPDVYGLPDPTIAPLQKALEAAGYLGTQVQPGVGIVQNEPSKGRVGGVGEMITASGGPEKFNAILRALTQGITGQRITAPSPSESIYTTGAPGGVMAVPGGDVGEGFTGGSETPRALAAAEAVPDWYRAAQQTPGGLVPGQILLDPANVSTYEELRQGGGAGSTTPYIDPSYITALRAVDPGAADRMAAFYRAAEFEQAARAESGREVGGE